MKWNSSYRDTRWLRNKHVYKCFHSYKTPYFSAKLIQTTTKQIMMLNNLCHKNNKTTTKQPNTWKIRFKFIPFLLHTPRPAHTKSLLCLTDWFKGFRKISTFFFFFTPYFFGGNDLNVVLVHLRWERVGGGGNVGGMRRDESIHT